MKFEFPPPVVQQKKKYATFTIKEIGGPAEIVKWREMQAAKETTYRMRIKARDDRLAEHEATLGDKLDRGQTSGRSWQEKLDHVNAERARLSKADERVQANPTWEPLPPPKLNLLQKFTKFIAGIWNNSGF